MEKIKKQIKKIKKWIKDNPEEATALAIILLVGAFLRLYRIDEYMTFLGDEGRDVIVVRRLLVNLDPILVGPGTSIGNMYLGPLYYYMMAPALLLAGFSPVGPAVMIALLGVATIFFVWYIARQWFGEKAAVIASSLYAVAPTVIFYSRSSWNPNIMPFFALLTVYATWKVWRELKWKWLVVAGISFAFVLQSHYLGLLLAPVVGFFWLLTLKEVWKDKKKRLKAIKGSLIGITLFSLLMSPLVIFDWRHGWRNFGAMHEFFAKRQTTVSARPWTAIPEMPEVVPETVERLVAGRDLTAANWTIVAVIAAALYIFAFNYKKLKKKELNAYLLIFIWLAVAFVGLGVYKQEIYDHYYGFFFAAPFLLIGGLSETLLRLKKETKGLIFVAIAALIVVNLLDSPVSSSPNRQLQRTKAISQKMIEEAGDEKFNIAVIAERNYEGAYQYFLEKWNAPFVIIDPQRADETITKQLFVVCELPEEKCQPTSNPKAEIANFGWSVIDEKWNLEGVVLYRLVHSQN